MKVLILGAGASCDYGFPLGKSLLDCILQCLGKSETDVTDLHRAFIRYGKATSQQKAFSEMADALIGSQLSSIDNFLKEYRHKKSFQDIGYSCIAYIIARYESSNKLLSRQTVSWYRLLHNQLYSKYSDFESYIEAPVSFITFNYDRSLEAFFMSALRHTFPKDATDSHLSHFLENKIVHIHGSIGSIFDLDYGPFTEIEGEIPSIVDRMSSLLPVMSERLKTTQDNNDSCALAKAREIIDSSSQVHFLGFSYDPVNMTKLGFPITRHFNIYGTIDGLTDNQAKEAFRLLIPTRTVGYDGFLKNLKCDQYINNVTLFP